VVGGWDLEVLLLLVLVLVVVVVVVQWGVRGWGYSSSNSSSSRGAGLHVVLLAGLMYRLYRLSVVPEEEQKAVQLQRQELMAFRQQEQCQGEEGREVGVGVGVWVSRCCCRWC
jgi:hypothetical protein